MILALTSSYRSPHEILRSVFLDISEAFGKIWIQGFLMKLKLNGTSGNLLKTMEDFLAKRYQRAVLNGQVYKWAAVNAGVPQGSIQGLIFINDLSNDL